MSVGSVSSLSSSNTFNTSSSSNSTPSVDKYAALKDLDEQFKEIKILGAVDTSTPTNPQSMSTFYLILPLMMLIFVFFSLQTTRQIHLRIHPYYSPQWTLQITTQIKISAQTTIKMELLRQMVGQHNFLTIHKRTEMDFSQIRTKVFSTQMPSCQIPTRWMIKWVASIVVMPLSALDRQIPLVIRLW